jgi:hypothetical protein
VFSAPVASPSVSSNLQTADFGDALAEVSVIMELGSDNAIGTVVNVTNDSRVGATTPWSSSANSQTVDQVLTLEPNVQPLASDFLLKVQQSAGTGAIEDFNVAAQTVTAAGGSAALAPATNQSQVEAQVIYSAANQSQAGTVDTLVNFDLNNDKLDFTGLKLSATDYDAVKNGIQIDEILKVVVGTLDTHTQLNNGFAPDQVQNPDLYAARQTNPTTGNVLFVLEAAATATATAGSVSPTGAYRLFVDANQDGIYNSTTDMVIDFSSEMNANINSITTPAALINSLVGTAGTFAPTNLGLLGVQVNIDPTGTNAIDSTFLI